MPTHPDTPDGQVEYKTLPFTLVDSGGEMEPNTFTGYVAVFNGVDAGGDVILPGAFKASLPTFLEDGAICWQHDWSTPIGKPLEAKEDAHGLFLRARISETTQGKDALTLMRDGVVKKLSIGYKADKAHYVDEAEGKALLGDDAYVKAMGALPPSRSRIRALEQITLFEGSPVTIPMKADANILAVKEHRPHAGLTLEEEYAQVDEANAALLARYESLIDLRAKSGRTLSGANEGKLRAMHASLTDHLAMLDSMLASLASPDAPDKADGEDTAKKAEQDEFIRALRREEVRFLQQQARLRATAV